MKREDQIRRTTESRKGDVITARSPTARARGLRAGVGALDRSATATGWKTGASTDRTFEEGSVAAGASQHVIAAGATQGAWPDSQGALAGGGQHDGHESMATTPAAGAVRDAIASATTAIRPFMCIESYQASQDPSNRRITGPLSSSDVTQPQLSPAARYRQHWDPDLAPEFKAFVVD